MVVSQTSLWSYFDIVNNTESMCERQKLVFNCIKSFNDKNIKPNNREISDTLFIPINTVTPRVKELRVLGLVRINGIKPDFVTGKTTQTYEVVNL